MVCPKNSYTYDTANQLIREDNQRYGKTWVWTYDDAGNILSRKEYAYAASGNPVGTVQKTVSYTYGNTAWGDLLTGYNNKTITSDAIGNMTSDGTWTYTWEHGRELASMRNSSATWTFTYDANGMRTKRTNGSTTYSYVYNGSQLSQMTAGSNTLNFFYDASGAPMAVDYNGATYYYVLNLQGDVVAILNSSGAKVVTYTYDAWGRPLTTAGSLASTLGQINPLRYRGYVYDTETGLYYLQSRYYNPTMGRFINADALASTGQGLLGNNMYAYCGNNPVNKTDLTGYAFTDIFAVYLGQGEASERPSRLYIPNTRRVDSWQEVAEVAVEFIGDVIASDPVQDIYGTYKAGRGAAQLTKGILTLAAPDPIPIVDEIVAVWDVGYGFFKLVMGIGEFTDWEEYD